MGFNVSDFKSKMGNDGLRPNLFEVSIAQSADSGASWNPAGSDFEFHCRAASIPGSTVGTVIVPYFGREVKFAGNRTFGDVTLTIINDENLDFSFDCILGEKFSVQNYKLSKILKNHFSHFLKHFSDFF